MFRGALTGLADSTCPSFADDDRDRQDSGPGSRAILWRESRTAAYTARTVGSPPRRSDRRFPTAPTGSLWWRPTHRCRARRGPRLPKARTLPEAAVRGAPTAVGSAAATASGARAGAAAAAEGADASRGSVSRGARTAVGSAAATASRGAGATAAGRTLPRRRRIRASLPPPGLRSASRSPSIYRFGRSGAAAALCACGGAGTWVAGTATRGGAAVVSGNHPVR